MAKKKNSGPTGYLGVGDELLGELRKPEPKTYPKPQTFYVNFDGRYHRKKMRMIRQGRTR